jgi:hypothetical protein
MLRQLLEKLGISDYGQLTAEEKKTYEKWAEVLLKKDATLDDVKKLIASERDRARTELERFENSKDRQIFYQALAHLTSTLDKFITTPAAERDQLKAHLKQVFNIDI